MATEENTSGRKRNFLKNFGPRAPKKPAADHSASSVQVSESNGGRASETPFLDSVSAKLSCHGNAEPLGEFLGAVDAVPDSIFKSESYGMVQLSPIPGSPHLSFSSCCDEMPVISATIDGTGGDKRPRSSIDFLGGKGSYQRPGTNPHDLRAGSQDDCFTFTNESYRHPHDPSMWVDPLRCHPVECFQQSTTRGLNVASEVKPASTSATVGSKDNEINTKVSEMLAATEALKPQGHSSGLGDTIPQSASSRVLAKVSNAWGKLYPKTSKEVSKGQGQSKSTLFPSGVGTKIRYIQRSSRLLGNQPAESSSSLTTMEIRLNEGNNLNNKKVQQLIGGQVSRKPLADDGKSLRSGSSISAVTVSHGRLITPEPPSGQSKHSSLGNENPTATPMLLDPFESEREFFGDLDTGLLSTPPTGSSTPKAKPADACSASVDESPLARRHRRTKSAGTSISPNQMSNAEINFGHEKHPSQDSLVGSVQYFERTKALLDLNGLSQPKMKKHPSPNKQDLELLQMALERMTPQLRKTTRESQGRDELADSSHQSTRLNPRDPNQSLGAQRVPKFMRDTVSSQSLPAARQSRLPRRVDKGPSINNNRRIAPPFRPPSLDADERDELL